MNNNENVFSETESPSAEQLFDAGIRSAAAAAGESYDIVKELLEKLEPQRPPHSGATLAQLLHQDIVAFIALLAIIDGSPDNYAVMAANGVCASDNMNRYGAQFIKAAEKIGIAELIKNQMISPEIDEALRDFTGYPYGVLEILTNFADSDGMSVIYYMYSVLLAAVAGLMERHCSSPVFYETLSDYLYTRFSAAAMHLNEADSKQFHDVLLPYMREVNAKKESMIEL